MSSWWLNGLSFIGIFALCGIAWLTSENRRVVPWKTIIWGIGLQLVLGLFVFLVPQTRLLVSLVNDAVNSVLDATEDGARFVFGPLLVPNPAGATLGPVLAGRWIARAVTPPYVPVPGDRLSPDNLSLGGYIFAFRALPSVIFFSALMSLLYALGLIQPIVNLFSKIFRRTMNLSGAESLSGSANIFVGIEALLVVRPYLARMTRSELCAILASCFGSIASTVLVIYVGFLRPVFPNITGHLVSASIMAIPACFVLAKIIVPETEIPETMGRVLRERVGLREEREELQREELLREELQREELQREVAAAEQEAAGQEAMGGEGEDERERMGADGDAIALPEKNAEKQDFLENEDSEKSRLVALSTQAETVPLVADRAHRSAMNLKETGLGTSEKMPESRLETDLRTAPEDESELAVLTPMESIVVGALEGVKLAAAIAALLIAVLGLVALVNLFFGNLASLATSSQPAIQAIGKVFQVVTLKTILGFLFVPFTFLMGVPQPDVWQASQLMGQRLLLTEIPSYQQLAALSSQGLISSRTLLIVSYALCGFAHLPSVGIFVGGLTGLIPSRRRDIAELSWKALWAATLATMMIGCVAGLYDTGNPGILGK
jgi:concentrative nucleoside transporter, CNT family